MFFCLACSDDDSTPVLPEEVVHTHYNILFASDLSNRINTSIYPRPLDDTRILGSLLNMIHPTILQHKRTVQQKDKFQVLFTNPRLMHHFDHQLERLKIDFGRFEHRQAERIAYINGEQARSLDGDKSAFLESFTQIYDQSVQGTHGADLWSFFQNGISDIHIEHQLPDTKTGHGAVCKNEFKNVLVLMTDGYLEAGMYGQKHCQKGHCPFLDYKRIDSFRKAFKESGQTDMKAFLQSSDFGITPVQNDQLQYLDVLVMEMYDRSKDGAGNATIHPSDYEITKVFWEDWLESSGVKRYDIRPCLSTTGDIEVVLRDFIL